MIKYLEDIQAPHCLKGICEEGEPVKINLKFNSNNILVLVENPRLKVKGYIEYFELKEIIDDGWCVKDKGD